MLLTEYEGTPSQVITHSLTQKIRVAGDPLDSDRPGEGERAP
ncbi:hypothetical protein ACH40D_21250 [Streptomyces olivaceoviridis]|nr:hypothetical protein [Streptomyces corchorusii]